MRANRISAIIRVMLLLLVCCALFSPSGLERRQVNAAVCSGSGLAQQQQTRPPDKQKTRPADLQRPKPAKELRLSDYHKKWLEEDVIYIITEEEKSVFKALTTNEERENFIEQF